MRFVLALTVAVVVAGTAQAADKKVQCWTDKDGHRMCGDRVPPEYAGKKREVLEGGRVIQTVKAAKTPEEIAEEKRQKAAADAAAEAVRKQAAYDRDLLETYRSAKDLESMRDERIMLIDSRVASAKKNSDNTDKSLTDLRARAELLTKNGKPVDDRLKKQIKQFEKSQKQNQNALARFQVERADVETKFNADIKRYNELRGLPATAPAAAPAAAAKPAAAPESPKPTKPAPATKN